MNISLARSEKPHEEYLPHYRVLSLFNPSEHRAIIKSILQAASWVVSIAGITIVFPIAKSKERTIAIYLWNEMLKGMVDMKLTHKIWNSARFDLFIVRNSDLRSPHQQVEINDDILERSCKSLKVKKTPNA
jgi:hypothetical protein